MGLLQILGIILLIIGIIFFFGPIIISFFGIQGLIAGTLLFSLGWFPGIICIAVGALLYKLG
ncbi:MAG: hypothetical protein QXO35_03875 [Candidatus Micrarchaeia archaeon]